YSVFFFCYSFFLLSFLFFSTSFLLFFFSLLRLPPLSTLFPYTTLFRSFFFRRFLIIIISFKDTRPSDKHFAIIVNLNLQVCQHFSDCPGLGTDHWISGDDR